MANTGIHNENDADRPDPSQRSLDGSRNSPAILLFPAHAEPPVGWQTPWAEAGWSVTSCATPWEIAEAAAGSPARALIASPWPDTGDAATTAAIARGLQGVIAALGIPGNAARIGSSVSGGMLRRGDFLAHLSLVMAAPESGCCVLLAIRVDQASELAARLDRTAIFDLEERIATRFAAMLRKDDAFTIWLEFGFGILAQRDHSEQVQELAQRICASVADEPFLLAGESSPLTVSVGVALPPRGSVADGAHRWFASAHAAQAIAFRHGGNRHDGVLSREFEPIPAERVLIIREWVQEARAGGNVMIEFQPVLPLNIGAEALYAVHAKLRDYRAPLGGVYRHEYLRLARDAGAMEMIDRLSLFGAFDALEQERARGRATRLLVPVDFASLEGVSWRWLEAELHRRRHLADGLIVELEAHPKLQEPDSVERLVKLRELGVRVGLSDQSGGLEWVSAWSRLPVDLLRLQLPVVDAVPADSFYEHLSPWREQGRQLIVDAVEEASAMARFNGLGVDYLRGHGLAAIGPRLDFEFAGAT